MACAWAHDGQSPGDVEKKIVDFLINQLELCPFNLVELFLVEPDFVEDAGYCIAAVERSVYFPMAYLGRSRTLDAAELLTRLLLRTQSLLASASFVVAISNRLDQTALARPLTANESRAWGVVASRFNSLTGNSVFVNVAGMACRADLRCVVYSASYFLYVLFGGHNEKVDEFLHDVARPPWRIAHGSWFWKRIMAVIRAAEITIIESAVVHHKSAWTDTQPVPHLLLDNHTSIFLTQVDWNLLVILLLFSNQSVLTESGALVETVNLPSQLASVPQKLADAQAAHSVPSEFT